MNIIELIPELPKDIIYELHLLKFPFYNLITLNKKLYSFVKKLYKDDSQWIIKEFDHLLMNESSFIKAVKKMPKIFISIYFNRDHLDKLLNYNIKLNELIEFIKWIEPNKFIFYSRHIDFILHLISNQSKDGGFESLIIFDKIKNKQDILLDYYVYNTFYCYNCQYIVELLLKSDIEKNQKLNFNYLTKQILNSDSLESFKILEKYDKINIQNIITMIFNNYILSCKSILLYLLTSKKDAIEFNENSNLNTIASYGFEIFSILLTILNDKIIRNLNYEEITFYSFHYCDNKVFEKLYQLDMFKININYIKDCIIKSINQDNIIGLNYIIEYIYKNNIDFDFGQNNQYILRTSITFKNINIIKLILKQKNVKPMLHNYYSPYGHSKNMIKSFPDSKEYKDIESFLSKLIKEEKKKNTKDNKKRNIKEKKPIKLKKFKV